MSKLTKEQMAYLEEIVEIGEEDGNVLGKAGYVDIVEGTIGDVWGAVIGDVGDVFGSDKEKEQGK